MLKRNLFRAIHGTEKNVDKLLNRLDKRFGWSNPIQIVGYYSYGTSEKIYIKGRVLKDKGLSIPSIEDSVWRNLLNTYKRLETDELPFVKLKVTYGSQVQDIQADEEGYFYVELPFEDSPSDTKHWQKATIEFVDEAYPHGKGVTTELQIQVPPTTARYGIISDIDDTIMITHATNFVKLARLTFLNNASTRTPFSGVIPFYKALQESGNPFFYVSSSPWNLHDLLDDFFALQDIPKGSFLLRDLGIDKTKLFQSSHGAHKLYEIRRILKTYPHLPFLLIGDSGQKDPEIFTTIVEEFPDRIAAVYIRDVSKDKRDAQVLKLAEKVNQLGIDMLLVADTLEAAKHAVSKGFIKEEYLIAIEKEVNKDI